MSFMSHNKSILILFLIFVLMFSAISINFGETGSEIPKIKNDESTRVVRQTSANNKAFANFSTTGCNGTYIDEDGQVILAWESPQSSYAMDGNTDLLCHFENIYEGEDGETAEIIDKNCTGFWDFDEGTGTMVNDRSGNENIGKIINGATWVKMPSGSALEFDGIDDYVTLPDIPLTNLTISHWVKADDVTGAEILTRRNGDTVPCNYQTQIYSNKFQFSRYLGSWDGWSTTKTLNTGQWYFLTATVEGGTLNLYVDGNLDSVHSITAIDPTGIQNTLLGKNRASTNWFDGIIDGVAIYNRSKSAEEIKADYNNQVSYYLPFETGKFGSGVRIQDSNVLKYPTGLKVDSSCAGLWRFDEGSGTIVRDGSGNGNHGTLVGWASPDWTEGVYGKALNFDGSDDRIHVPHDQSLNVTDEITIESWVKPIDSKYHCILMKGNYGYGFEIDASTGVLGFWDQIAWVSVPKSTGKVTTDIWQHAATTVVDEGSSLKINYYINGNLVDSVTSTQVDIHSNAGTLYIGTQTSSGNTNNFKGTMDEVAVYNRAKSQSELFADYSAAGQTNFNIHQGTIELWVKPDWNGNSGEDHVIFFSGNEWNNDSFFIFKDTDNYLKFITADNNSNYQGYPKVDISHWKKDNWYHLVFTWDASGDKNIFIDGFLAASATGNYMPSEFYPFVCIGSSPEEFNAFNGVIDELRISNRVREEFELRDYFSIGTYESEVLDAGESVAWEEIKWNSDVPEHTELHLQSRTSDDNVTWTQWTGNSNPSGLETLVYMDNTGEPINAEASRYIQWRAILKSTNGLNTPVLHNVTIIWNHLPTVVNVTISPQQPTFYDDLIIDYDYSDKDGHQEGNTKFEWYVDRGLGFVASNINTQNLDSKWTSYQERWYCVITPHDGYNYGFPVPTPTVTIDHGNITKIEILPAFAVVSADNQVQFSAVALDEANNNIQTTFYWNVTGGGNIDQNGLFTPETTGVYSVYAQAVGEQVYGAALVTVIPGELGRIHLSPQNPILTTDDAIDFKATFFDAKNNTIPGLEPTWNTTGGGNIDNLTGIFEATTPGQYTVSAIYENITGSTTVNIETGAPHRLNLTPQNPAISADDQVQFNIEAFDKENNEITTDFEWQAENGKITTKGLFIPEKTGIWKIAVLFNISGIETNTTVSVSHGKIVELRLEPEIHTIPLDNELQFSTIGSDAKGNQWSNVEDVEWSIDNDTLGIITQEGLFKALKSGKITVTAASGTVDGISGRAYITISTDWDNDGMLDEWEREYGLNFKDTKDAGWDEDGDGLNNLEEHEHDTDPRNSDTDNDGYSDKEEIKEGTDPNDASDYPTKEAHEDLMQMIFLIIIIILIVVIVALAYTRRKRKKPEEEEEEELWEKEEGEEKLEEEEIEEKEEPEELEPEELEEELDLEEPTTPEPEEEDLIDFEMPEEEEIPVKKKTSLRGMGKMPMKGKLPKKKAEEVIEPEHIDTEEEYSPEIVKLEEKSVVCGVCLGAIKTGLMAIKCKCGKYYHESCGVRVGECPRCDRKFRIEQLAKLKDDEVEELEELEESELSPDDFEKQKEKKKKTEREKVAKILSGLEERLAAGEISESTYLMLREKYEE